MYKPRPSQKFNNENNFMNLAIQKDYQTVLELNQGSKRILLGEAKVTTRSRFGKAFQAIGNQPSL